MNRYTKEDLVKIRSIFGAQIKERRKDAGISTYDLEKLGFHPTLPTTIEKGKHGYTIDTLLHYMRAIDSKLKIDFDAQQKRCSKKDM